MKTTLKPSSTEDLTQYLHTQSQVEKKPHNLGEKTVSCILHEQTLLRLLQL